MNAQRPLLPVHKTVLKRPMKLTGQEAMVCFAIAAVLQLMLNYGAYRLLSAPAFIGSWLGASLGCWGIGGVSLFFSRAETAKRNWAITMVVMTCFDWYGRL